MNDTDPWLKEALGGYKRIKSRQPIGIRQTNALRTCGLHHVVMSDDAIIAAFSTDTEAVTFMKRNVHLDSKYVNITPIEGRLW